MKQLHGLLILFFACVSTGCGSSKVVVDEDGIKAQIAKVENEESTQRKKEPVAAPAQQQMGNSESDPGAEGAN